MASWEMNPKWPGWFQEVLGPIYAEHFDWEDFRPFFPCYPDYAYTGKAYIGAGGMKCNG